MIAYLHGTVHEVWDQQVILLSQGVGYLVTVSNSTLSTLEKGQELSLSIYTKVKEDDLALFGFANRSERQFFAQLLSVSGIGTKTAMGIMDMPLEMVARALHEEDVSYLSQAPGLGKKTASRLILELKGKVDIHLQMDASAAVSNVPRSLQEDALQALESLGYDKPTITRFLNTTENSYESAEELVRGFLQHA